MAVRPVGSFHLVRYRVAGGRLWHERLVLAPVGSSSMVMTPDGDRYEESTQADHDIAEFRFLSGQGEHAGLPNLRVYVFHVLLPHDYIVQAFWDAARAMGTFSPGDPSLQLGVGNLFGRAAGAIALAPRVPLLAPEDEPPAPAPVGAACAAAPAENAGLDGLRDSLGGEGARAPQPAARGAADDSAGADGDDDVRVLPVAYDSQGQIFRNAREWVKMLAEHKISDWPIVGAHITLWVLHFMVKMTGSPTAWHTKWASENLVWKTDEHLRLHEMCYRMLETAISYDQLNAPALASLEVTAMQIQLIEAQADEQSHAPKDGKKRKQPVSDAVDDAHLCVGFGGLGRTTLCSCPVLTTWIAEEFKREYSVAKERRTAREYRERERVLRAWEMNTTMDAWSERHGTTAPHLRDGARNRDICPLPGFFAAQLLLGKDQLSGGTFRRLKARFHWTSWLNDGIAALNSLHGSRLGSFISSPLERANLSQQKAMENIIDTYRTFPTPSTDFNGEGTLSEFLAGSASYHGDGYRVRLSVKDRVSWPAVGVSPVPLFQNRARLSSASNLLTRLFHFSTSSLHGRFTPLVQLCTP